LRRFEKGLYFVELGTHGAEVGGQDFVGDLMEATILILNGGYGGNKFKRKKFRSAGWMGNSPARCRRYEGTERRGRQDRVGAAGAQRRANAGPRLLTGCSFDRKLPIDMVWWGVLPR
jgi:hypothetical protein